MDDYRLPEWCTGDILEMVRQIAAVTRQDPYAIMHAIDSVAQMPPEQLRKVAEMVRPWADLLSEERGT